MPIDLSVPLRANTHPQQVCRLLDWDNLEILEVEAFLAVVRSPLSPSLPHSLSPSLELARTSAVPPAAAEERRCSCVAGAQEHFKAVVAERDGVHRSLQSMQATCAVLKSDLERERTSHQRTTDELVSLKVSPALPRRRMTPG